MTTIAELINRWNTDEGKPYKGSLIDLHTYNENPSIGCMCAQGQVLHLVAGWTPNMLITSSQSFADTETAKLLNISRTHSILLRTINDRADGAPGIVLTDPGKVLGDKWSVLLDFWWHVNGMTSEQWAAARAAAWANAHDGAREAAWAAAGDAAGAAARNAACAMIGAGGAFGAASSEIQGADILRKNGTPLFFLPAFGFASIADIPPRPENYGIIK